MEMRIDRRFIDIRPLDFEWLTGDPLSLKEFGGETVYISPKAQISLKKKFEIAETLHLGSQYLLKYKDEVLYFECVQIKHNNNQNGTYDEVYILKRHS